jgi:hypothetical protein
MKDPFPAIQAHPCQSRHLPDSACVPTAAFCHRCEKVTPTEFLNLRSGLIGNVCQKCRTCRRGRPYVGRWDLKPKHHDAGTTGQGVRNECQQRMDRA